MALPDDIKEICFETLCGDKSVLAFEEWLYTNKSLEDLLTAEDYLALISYGYKGDGVKYGLYKILEKLIDKGEYEKWKLLRLLHKALQRDDELPQTLMAFYYLYCRGYYFLQSLGLGYGLAVEVPYSRSDTWDELTASQQKDLLSSFYPDLEYEILQVIDWIERGKVVLTGTHDEYNHYEYIDNRNNEEKLSSKKAKQKPWWKLW